MTAEHQARHLVAIGEVVRALAPPFGGEPPFARILDSVVRHTAADGAVAWLADASGERPVPAVRAGDVGERDGAPGARLAERVRERGESVYVADAGAHAATRDDWPAGTALCAVPVTTGRGPDAVMIAHAARGAGRLHRDIELLERLAELAAIALAASRLAEASRGELRRTCAMSEFGHLLSGTGDPLDTLDAVCRNLLGTLELDHASVSLADRDGTLVQRASWTSTANGPSKAEPLPPAAVAETIARWCHEHREAAEIDRDAGDPRESPRARAARRALGIGAVCCIPIRHDGRSLGSVLVGRTRGRNALDESEIHLLDAVVNQLAAALGRHALTTALQHQAYHDSLTRLPNRRWFEEELERTLSDPARHGARGAVLFLDLDGFKLINDTLGHPVGDSLLRHVSDRLAGRVGERDVLARMGGDEFAVIVRGLRAEESAVAVGQRLADALASEFDVDGARLKIGTSIGVSHYPDDAETADELLRQADLAMYKAKGQGKGRVLGFDRALGSEAFRRAELELELRDAIERDEFALLFQPQVACRDGRVIGVEALIRWHHPTRGPISPGEFIPIAEEAGLINAIGAWVLEEAIGELAGWHGTPLEALRMSVNIAAPQFLLENFPDQVLAALARHAVRPEQLELEVTESVVMRELDAVVARLERLRSAGIRVAIDDFGTGYSSLSYLQDLPLDVLKIDRAFVVRMQDERRGRSLVDTIQLLASALGLETVAEGVETDGQRDAIAALGCDLIQGYHYSRPVPAAELADVVAAIHGAVGPEAERSIARSPKAA